MSIAQIFEGFRNKLIPPAALKKEIDRVGGERMDICNRCPNNSAVAKQMSNYVTIRPDVHCTICLCNLDAKSKCLSCQCPINKWLSVVTAEVDDQIKKVYAGDNTQD